VEKKMNSIPELKKTLALVVLIGLCFCSSVYADCRIYLNVEYYAREDSATQRIVQAQFAAVSDQFLKNPKISIMNQIGEIRDPSRYDYEVQFSADHSSDDLFRTDLTLVAMNNRGQKVAHVENSMNAGPLFYQARIRSQLRHLVDELRLCE